MNKKWIPVIVLALSFVLVLVIFFTVLRPYVLVSPPTEEETLDKEGEEDEIYGILTLYPSIKREEMQRITVSNENGSYSFTRKRAADSSSAFVLSINGESFSHIDFDDEKFASLVVATGTTYVEERMIGKDVLEAMSPEEREAEYAKYGLDKASNPNYFEVEKFEKQRDANGKLTTVFKTYRVYVGNETVSGGHYYLRFNDSAAVYVSGSASVGTVTGARVAHFANLTLQSESVGATNGCYLMKDVTLWNRGGKNATVAAEDTVTVLYTRLEGNRPTGKEHYERATIDLRELGEKQASLFVGKKVGAVDLYMAGFLGEEGNAVYHIKQIIAIDKLFVNYSFVNESERDKFFNGVVYSFGAPFSVVNYIADSDACMDISESLVDFKADEIVEIGITDEILEKYGLYAHTLYFELPMDLAYSDVSGKENDFVIENYLANYLYFSDVQSDGTRYVASLGYDVVGKIKADAVNFLDVDIFHFVNPFIYIVDIDDVKSIAFDFGYADFDKTFTFDIAHKKDKDGVYIADAVYYREGDRRLLDIENFSEVYSDALIMQYLGTYEEAGRTPDELVADCTKVLTMTVTLQDGRSMEYGFYAYSERYVLSSVGGQMHFYTLARHIKKLASDIEKLLDGETPDHEKFY